MLIDNDEAKRQFPEFNKGWGANTVHKESQIVEQAVFKQALSEGRNIVLPKVGSDAGKLVKSYISYAKDAGYKINVHFVDLDRNKALGRMMGRFIHTGRYLSPKLIDKYANERDGNRIAQAYEELKMMDVIDGYSKWDNDVGRGEKPILLETANLDDDFIKNARMKGDMENEERKHGQFNRGSEDDLCISGDSAGDRGTHEHSGGRNPGENERDGEHDASGEISVPEEDLRQVSGIVEEFRANTRDKFHELDGENSESIETMVRGHIEDAIETFGLDAKVVDVVLVGSRSRGIEHEESDVNVVVEFYGSEREDALSDILNEEGLSIAGKTIDINTITKDRTGTLETFLPEEEKYLAEKAAAMEQTAASKNMVADMSIEQAAEAELKSSDEKKRQHPDQKRGGKFANFSMQKKENSEKYNLYADVQYPSGEIDRHKCIAQFDNKSLAQRFCEKRGLQCEDVTGNLDSVIKHKKQLANQKGKISPDRNERKPGRGIGD